MTMSPRRSLPSSASAFRPTGASCERGRELGGYLQPHLLAPAALARPSVITRRQAIMSEIAVLDF